MPVKRLLPPLLPALLVCVPGCSLFDRPEPAPPPTLPTPAHWSSATADPVEGDWVAALQDPRLSSLVQQGLRNSPDLHALAARVQAAWAQADATGAARWPEITAGLDRSRARRSSTLGTTNVSGVSQTNEATLNISWEADLWQRITNQTRAAGWDAQAVAEDYAAAQLSLAANISRTWFQAIAARQQTETLRLTLDNYRANLTTVEEGVIAGINPVLDLRLLRAQAAAAESQLAAAERTHASLVLAIEVLLGEAPQGSLQTSEQLPELSGTPGAGLPLQLLERRPDLRAVRHRLLSQEERTLAARKNLLPALRIGGSWGRTASDLADLTDPNFLAWNIATSLAQPVFSGGRLRAERDAAQAERDARIAEYAGATLQAIREVEDALQAERWLLSQLQAQQVATVESVSAEELAREQYAAGLVDIATLLEAQRRSLDAQRTLIDLRSQRLQNRVDLHLALGGPLLNDTPKAQP